MGKIVISQNVSIDGAVQDPTGEEGFRRGGWFTESMNGDREAWAQVECEEALGAEAMLLGRRSYEYFAERWQPRSGEWADKLNGMPKYVVSSTLVDPGWSNTTVLGGDLVSEASDLRRRVDGEIVVYASRGLVRPLMDHGLVDELRLIVFPVVLGAGERLFGAETRDKMPLRLIETRPLGEGLAYMRYAVEA